MAQLIVSGFICLGNFSLRCASDVFLVRLHLFVLFVYILFFGKSFFSYYYAILPASVVCCSVNKSVIECEQFCGGRERQITNRAIVAN